MVSPLADLPRAADGGVDIEALAGSLRAAAGRLHRFDSPAAVPGGSGWTLLVVPSGGIARPTVDGLTTTALPAADDAAQGDPQLPTHVVALPYEPGQPAFLEEAAAVVAIRGDAVVVRGTLPPLDEAPPRPTSSPPAERIAESLGRERFLRAVEAIIESIAAGDVYLVNITQQLRARWTGDVHDLHRALRATSPAPHSAVIETAPGVGLASASPETFVRGVGRDLTIRPIKGTRPRSDDAATDHRLAAELAASEKERAENVMVVDLERNDLGQVCEIGSVEVPALCEVEAHPTVWQLVSTVTGRLRADLGYGDVLSSCSPCGSVTGAPKTSAIAVAASLERAARGWYCGALGWLAPGRMETAVTIRTAVVGRGGVVTWGTGSGIVADSDPGAEYAETWAKALPFLRAVGAAPRHDGSYPLDPVGR